jgi:DNA polymerase-1
VHLGIDIKTLSNVVASRINDFPLSEILPYNGLDALASALVYRKPYMQRIAANDSNYARFNEAAISTAYMELMGLPVDLTASAELRAQWQTASQDAVRDVPHIYEVRKFEEERQKEFNLASSRDVGDALAIYGKIPLPRTAQQYSTSDETLQKLCPEHPLAKAVLAGRSADKMISTYIEPCEQVPSLYYDGMLHPGYTALLTATTRLSSNGPNIQNFPKRKHKELRRQVVPPPGHIFVAFDYGQLEARLIAMASKDRNLCKFILDGFDIHSKWLNNCLDIYPEYLDTLAVEVNQTDPKKIRKYGRDIIKTHFVFSSFFGSGVDSIARTTQIPKHLVERLQGSFWKEFDGVKRWIKQQRQLYANEGSTRFMIGLERHAVLWGNEPINNPIQSCAAVLVVESMNELSRLARSTGDMNWHPRINIHDDLIFCLPDDERMDPYIERIMEIMVKVRFDWQIVPLMVEARCGYSWDDLEEFTTHTGDYVR